MNVLFLCTGNSARSILCEAYLNAHAGGRFHGFSAGSFPTGHVNPLTLETLSHAGLDSAGYRSKCWDEFARAGAPHMDIVITVCDNAAGEVCPAWPGQPVTAHWSFADPAAFEGTDDEKRARFREIFRQIRNRIDLLLQLPPARLERLALKHELDTIGRSAPVSAPLGQRLAAEAVGTAFLLAGVVGSGIMAERLTHDVALALLCNTVATAAILAVLIDMFVEISGAHFNPAVTMVSALSRALPVREAIPYVLVQIAGAVAGVWLAHAMFGDAIFALGVKARTGIDQWLSEGVATFGLILTILGTARHGFRTTAACVGLYIGAALLVHRLDLVRQPGRDDCARADTDLRRHPPRRRRALHRVADRGRARRRARLTNSVSPGRGAAPLTLPGAFGRVFAACLDAVQIPQDGCWSCRRDSAPRAARVPAGPSCPMSRTRIPCRDR